MRKSKATLRDEVCYARRSNDSLRVNFVFFVRQFEKLVVQAHRFVRSQTQVAAGIERVMKLRDAALVQFRAQVNEHVAATDQVEPAKWRIGRDILTGNGA